MLKFQLIFAISKDTANAMSIDTENKSTKPKIKNNESETFFAKLANGLSRTERIQGANKARDRKRRFGVRTPAWRLYVKHHRAANRQKRGQGADPRIQLQRHESNARNNPY